MNKLTTIKFVIQFNDYTLLQNKYLDLNFTQLTSDLNPRISKFIILLIILIYKYFTRRVTWNKLANGTRGKQKKYFPSFVWVRDVNVFIFQKNYRSLWKRRRKIENQTIVSLTIVNDDPSLTIVNDESPLTIVNDDPSLKIVNDPSLMIVNIIFNKFVV